MFKERPLTVLSEAKPLAPPNATHRRMYRPELDLLRLLAFLLVFFHHSLPFFSGHPTVEIVEAAAGSGLQLFFLLSSYLITELLLREREETGSIHLQAFFIRRMLRIWPLYFFAIGGALAVSHLTHFLVLTDHQFLFFLLLAGNWWSAFHTFIPTAVGPLWSISVEEQFYIAWPLLGRLGGRRALAIAAAACIVFSTAALAFLGMHLDQRPAVSCNSFVEFQFFAAGAILALFLHNRIFRPPVYARALLLALAAAALLYAEAGFHVVRAPRLGVLPLLAGYTLITAGVVLLFLGFFGARIPSWSKPFLYFGKISYGLYVFHYISIHAVYLLLRRHHGVGAAALKLATALAITVALASISYRFLELPFLRLKRRFTFVPNRTD